MKILIITEDFPPMPGGIASFLSELCNALSKLGHQVRVQVKKMPGFEIFDRGQPYEFIRYDAPKRLRSFVIGWHLIKQCIQQRPDIIFMGHVLGTRGIAVTLIRWFFRIPYVVLIHGGHLPLAHVNKINKMAVFFLLRHADLLIANSTYTRKLLLERGFSKGSIKVLHPGVDIDYFYPSKDKSEIQEIKRSYCSLDTKLIVNVARLVPKKNHIRLIEAMAGIRKKGKPVKCVIAGHGPERERLERLIQSLGASNEITLVGTLDRKQVRDLFRAADVVVLASTLIDGHHESFGIVAMEAASCGKPVIVGSEGGQADSVIHEKTGLVINADSPDEIAQAIVRLIENRGLAKQLGEAGRERAVEEFAWERVAAKAEKMLECCVSNRM